MCVFGGKYGFAKHALHQNEPSSYLPKVHFSGGLSFAWKGLHFDVFQRKAVIFLLFPGLKGITRTKYVVRVRKTTVDGEKNVLRPSFLFPWNTTYKDYSVSRAAYLFVLPLRGVGYKNSNPCT